MTPEALERYALALELLGLGRVVAELDVPRGGGGSLWVPGCPQSSK